MYVKTVGRKLFLLGQMIRVRTTILMFLFTVMGAFYAGNSASYFDLFIVLVIIALWYANGTSLNDLADEKIDAINLKLNAGERPLVKGNGSRNELRVLAAVSAGLAVAVSFVLSPLSALFTILALLYGYAYSTPPLKISYRGIVATLSLSAFYVLYPFLLGFELNKPQHVDVVRLAIFLVSLYACFIARILLKDIRDVVGDKKFGKRTFIVRYGQAATAVTSAIFWVIGVTGLTLYYSNPLFTLTSGVLSVAIIAVLGSLAKERLLENQLIYVAAMGRFANGVAFLSLTWLLPVTSRQLLLSTVALCVLYSAMGIESLLHLKKPA
jgi:4-hydroxybenzoate polyprenyltransferase